MNTEMGEYLVGAYLKQIEKCDVVDYNVRPPGGKLEGLNEFDVIGLRFADSTAFMCEVTTHLRGMNYSNIERVRKKFGKQRQFAEQYFSKFECIYFMFWSPNVPKGSRLNQLNDINGLQVIVNSKFKSRVEELKAAAREGKQTTQNPAFRLLQILESVRE